jgi:ribosome-associated toxin RatA of RatAB toxin-antitoxin module
MKPFWVCLAGGILALAVSSHGAVQPLELGEKEMGRLSQGEVLVSSVESEKGFVQAAILLDVPVEKVWALIVDCPNASKFIPNLKSCVILERHDGWDVIEQHVRLSWLLPDIICRFRADYKAFQQIHFKSISGNLKELEGRWIFERAAGGGKTVLLYSVYVNPGFFIPQWAVRLVLERDLTGLLISKKRTDSSIFNKSVPTYAESTMTSPGQVTWQVLSAGAKRKNGEIRKNGIAT